MLGFGYFALPYARTYLDLSCVHSGIASCCLGYAVRPFPPRLCQPVNCAISLELMQSTDIQICTLHGSYTRVLPGCKVRTWTSADHDEALQTSQVCSRNSAAGFGVTFRKRLTTSMEPSVQHPSELLLVVHLYFCSQSPFKEAFRCCACKNTSARVPHLGPMKHGLCGKVYTLRGKSSFCPMKCAKKRATTVEARENLRSLP